PSLGGHVTRRRRIAAAERGLVPSVSPEPFASNPASEANSRERPEERTEPLLSASSAPQRPLSSRAARQPAITSSGTAHARRSRGSTRRSPRRTRFPPWSSRTDRRSLLPRPG